MGAMVLTESGRIGLASSVMAQSCFMAWGEIPPYLPAPTSVILAEIAGGTLTPAVYSYVVTCYNQVGESIPSSVAVLSIASNKSIKIDWAAVAGATGYRVYGRVGGIFKLIAQVLTNTYTDESATALGVDAPVTNTTSVDPWTTVPAPVNSSYSTLFKELGRRKVLIKKYVKSDPAGEYSFPSGNWTESVDPTKHLLFTINYNLEDAYDKTIYQLGVFLGTVPIVGQENNPYLSPNQIDDPGFLLGLENVVPIYRNNATRESFDLIITF